MKTTAIAIALMAGTSLGALSAPAMAATPREAELEARLNALESALGELRSELAAARAENKAASSTAQAASEKVATWEAKASKPEDGFKVGGTTIKINGYFKAVGSVTQYDDGVPATDSVGRDFYLPGTIPVGGVREGKKFEGNAKQTRIWLTTATPIGTHMLKGHLEFDFQATPGAGQQRTTNAYNLAMRRGFITYDNWLFGQEWTNFQYTAALPETTDYIGVSEGTVFVRQMQVRYTKKLSDKLALSVAAENPETSTFTPAAVENKDDRVPDATIRLNYASKVGEFSLAGLVRQLTVEAGAVSDSATGWGLSFAGKLPFGANKRHDLRFMVTKGDGIGRYVGVNFAPDALVNATTGQLDTTDILAGFAALRLGLTDKLRTNLMASFQDVDYGAGAALDSSEKAWSVAGNLFYSPVKNFDLGIEYRHGERELLSGAKGQLDRLEFAAKYSF